MNIDANIDFWIKNGYNVLFRGKHGVGKTATILESFGRNNLKWQYFSASTMDPWVDFIGVPKERIDENGNSYLDLVRPKHFQEDKVEAIFLDEFNRSSKKVRNAVMELIQFKSINGKKFNNLKIIWAAINPEDDEDEEYDVEKLDPAQLDRFHICVDFPYVPSVTYFRKKYGESIANVAVTWWKELQKNEKDKVSPRRLDYTIDIYKKGGDIRFALPKNVNVSKLLTELQNGPISGHLKELFEGKDNKKAKDFLAVENNYAACVNYLVKKQEYLEYFIPLLPDEKVAAIASKNNEAANYVFNHAIKFEPVIQSLAQAQGNKKLAKRARGKVKELAMAKKFKKLQTTVKVVDVSGMKMPMHFAKNSVATQADVPAGWTTNGTQNTQNRKKMYQWLVQSLPEHMSEDDGKFFLDQLINIGQRSQVGTLHRELKKLIPMINYVVIYFNSQKWKIPSTSGGRLTSGYLFDKLTSSNFPKYIYA